VSKEGYGVVEGLKLHGSLHQEILSLYCVLLGTYGDLLCGYVGCSRDSSFPDVSSYRSDKRGHGIEVDIAAGVEAQWLSGRILDAIIMGLITSCRHQVSKMWQTCMD
jgi:hypothetical protein